MADPVIDDHAFTVARGDRDVGLVYRDDARATTPATHALAIGIGAYASNDFPFLTSPTVSARTIAGWFVGKQADGVSPSPSRFRDQDRPLGSLALLLSETSAGGPQALFAGAGIPRATYDAVDQAIAEWVARASAHPDNLGVIYVCGHGVEDDHMTALVLEDRDENAEDLSNGLINLQLFANRLERAPFKSQLALFDCCRSPHDLRLPRGESLELRRFRPRPNPGFVIEQAAYYATVPGSVASGRRGRTSLFADALLRALDHAAADRSEGRWSVRSGGLIQHIQRVLTLHADSAQRVQRLNALAVGDFRVHQPEVPRDWVRTYVALDDPSRWPQVTIIARFADGSTQDLSALKTLDDPFIDWRVPPEKPVLFEARVNGDLIGEFLADEPDRPVLFVRIGANQAQLSRISPTSDRGMHPPPPATGPSPASSGAGLDGILGQVLGGPAEAGRSGDDLVKNLTYAVEIAREGLKSVVEAMGGEATWPPVFTAKLRLDGPRDAGFTVRIASRDVDGAPDVTLAVTGGDTAEATLLAGRHAMTIIWSDGRIETRALRGKIGETLEIAFSAPSSPHEWLVSAVAAGVLRPIDPAYPLDLTAQLIAPPGFGPSLAAATITPEEAGADLHLGPRVGNIARLEIVDRQVQRFRPASADAPRKRPIWIAGEIGGRTFLAAAPAVGTRLFAWRPHLVVQAGADGPRIDALVEDMALAPMFAMLARRDFAAAAPYLEAATSRQAQDSGNPIALAAAALVQIALNLKTPGFDDDWRAKFARLTPGLPDAPVIAARALSLRPDAAAQSVAIRELLLQGVARGVPIFSLALDWLADGLDRLAFDDSSLEQTARTVRAASLAADETALFTTIAT